LAGGYIYHQQLSRLASDFLDGKLSPDHWVDTLINDQFYLNRKLITEKGLDLKTVQTMLAGFLVQQKGIAFAYSASSLIEGEFTAQIGLNVQNGFQPKLSGDVVMVMDPGYFEYEDDYLVEHGSGYNYDTNIPLIWFGHNIRKGETWQLHYITDVAPTLSMILRISYPNACIGNPLMEINGNR